MRLLAACTGCKRQYDAGKLKPGDRFHCSCGTLVTVAAPTSAILSVAHCGTCGAARTTQGRHCAFCNSAFADVDLRRDTMCPACYGHIATNAHFCDHCGAAIQPTRMAGSASTLPCPVCQNVNLQSRHLSEASHPIEECLRCGGAWLEMVLFDRIVDGARSKPATGGPRPSAPRSLPPAGQGPLYRPCPVCREIMNRRNYGGSSAVIIDSCKDHGIWFDADELGRLVAWVRSGGLDRQRERERDEAASKRRAAQAQPTTKPTTLPQPRGDDLLSYGADLLDFVVNGIFRTR